MASLATYFIKNKEDLVTNKSMVVMGKHYRFSILTERLIRLEYSEEGYFEDRASSLVIFRNFSKPLFNLEENNTFLRITTKYFTLEYYKEKPFTGGKLNKGSLRVILNNTKKYWYYNHPEVRNFGGTNISLDDYQKNDKLTNGLYSTDGFVTIDDSKTLVLDNDHYIKRNHPNNIDLYLFMYLKDFGLCLRDYFKLTGFPTMIPRYSLGCWWYKNDKYSMEDVKEVVRNFSSLNIPLSVILLGNKWSDVASNYSFDQTLFPDIPHLIKFLHDRDIKLALSVDPSKGLTSKDERISEVRKILNIDNNKKIELLPFNDILLGIYFKLYIRPLEDKGIDLFYIDYYNKKDLTSLWTLQQYHFANSGRGENKRGLILSRNSLIAPHRYPVLFSGKTKVDWETLNFLPFYNSSSSNIGVSWWAHPIGGYYGGIEDEELYLRYVEFGTFSPIFILSADAGKYYKRAPWQWNTKISKIVSSYMLLRLRLIPYLYSEGYIYHKTGSPLIKPLYYTYPLIYDEPSSRNEYLLGSEMLVIPITKKKDLVMDRAVLKLFIPKGTWYDFNTGKKFPGNNYYIGFYRDEDYPVFVKAGAIIPLSNDEGTNVPVNLELQIFPGQSNTYRFYEDDGYSNLYKEGYYLLTSIEYIYRDNNYSLIIRPLEGKTNIIPEYRNYKIRFRNTKTPDNIVTYENSLIIHQKSYPEKNDYIIEVSNVKTISTITINLSGNEMLLDSSRVINEEISQILSDVEIETSLKEKLDEILFSDMEVKKKRIEVRKLKHHGLETKYIKMFLKLLEYINEI